MKRILIHCVGLLVLLNVSAHAEQTSDLEFISQWIKKDSASHYAFTQQRRVAVLSQPVKSSGQLFFSAHEGMCWWLQKPYEARLFISETGIHEVDSQGKTRFLMASGNPVFETFSRVYLALFQGQLAELQRDFQLTPTLSDHSWSLSILPIADNSLNWLKTIELRYDDDAGTSLKLTEKNGDETLMQFSTHTLQSSEQSPCW